MRSPRATRDRSRRARRPRRSQTLRRRARLLRDPRNRCPRRSRQNLIDLVLVLILASQRSQRPQRRRNRAASCPRSRCWGSSLHSRRLCIRDHRMLKQWVFPKSARVAMVPYIFWIRLFANDYDNTIVHNRARQSTLLYFKTLRLSSVHVFFVVFFKRVLGEARHSLVASQDLA